MADLEYCQKKMVGRPLKCKGLVDWLRQTVIYVDKVAVYPHFAHIHAGMLTCVPIM